MQGMIVSFKPGTQKYLQQQLKRPAPAEQAVFVKKRAPIPPSIPKPTKPKTVFIGPNDLLNSIREGIQTCSAVILKGPSGCGKQTAVQFICETLNMRLKVWHDNDFPDTKSFEKILTDILTVSSFGKKTVHLFDHFEDWSQNSSSLQNLLNRTTRTNPIVFTITNEYRSCLQNIAKYGRVLDVKPLSKDHAKRYLMFYSNKMKIPFNMNMLDAYDGDLRAALRRVDMHNFGSYKDDRQLSYIVLCESLMIGHPKPVGGEDETSLILQSLTNNYVQVFNADLTAVCNVADILSISDTFGIREEGFARQLVLDGMACVRKQAKKASRQWVFPKRVFHKDVQSILYASIKSYAHKTLETRMQALDRITILKNAPIILPKFQYVISGPTLKNRSEILENLSKTHKQREKTMRLYFSKMA